MHMSVYGTKNLCLPTSFENLNLCSDFSQKKNEKSICYVCACACVWEREFVCVFKEGVLIRTGEGAGDSEILI